MIHGEELVDVEGFLIFKVHFNLKEKEICRNIQDNKV